MSEEIEDENLPVEEELNFSETVTTGVSLFTLFGLIIIALVSGVMYKTYMQQTSKPETQAADPEMKSNLVEPLLTNDKME